MREFLKGFILLSLIAITNLILMFRSCSSFTISSSIHALNLLPYKRLHTTMSANDIKQFFKLSKFAVVGASTDRTKFGNKVLRAYQQKSLAATPVNKKVEEIEGVRTKESLTKFAEGFSTSDISLTGVSIITPPAVTREVIEEGYNLGFRWFFLQPGTADRNVKEYCERLKNTDSSFKLIEDCVLVQLGFSDHF